MDWKDGQKTPYGPYQGTTTAQGCLLYFITKEQHPEFNCDFGTGQNGLELDLTPYPVQQEQSAMGLKPHAKVSWPSSGGDAYPGKAM